MLVIRFQRIGRRNDPAFRIVVTEKRSKPQSAGLEKLGSYNPKTKETVLNRDRILYWISKGAGVSDTVYNLLISKGVISGRKRNVVPLSKSKVAEEGQGAEGKDAAESQQLEEEKVAVEETVTKEGKAAKESSGNS